ncbi:MAG: ATP-binding domain-containing protein [Lepagella sp.]
MTYHSAKGLQFETVILPFYEGTNDKETQKARYVAMTRSIDSYICNVCRK